MSCGMLCDDDDFLNETWYDEMRVSSLRDAIAAEQCDVMSLLANRLPLIGSDRARNAMMGDGC